MWVPPGVYPRPIKSANRPTVVINAVAYWGPFAGLDRVLVDPSGIFHAKSMPSSPSKAGGHGMGPSLRIPISIKCGGVAGFNNNTGSALDFPPGCSILIVRENHPVLIMMVVREPVPLFSHPH